MLAAELDQLIRTSKEYEYSMRGSTASSTNLEQGSEEQLRLTFHSLAFQEISDQSIETAEEKSSRVIFLGGD